MTPIARIAPDVGWLPVSFVNVYFVGHPGGPWALIDSGVPGSANLIANAAAARFGSGSRPEAIYLTHGHFDHAGSARRLAAKWDVPIYAHVLERPYLTGVSAYPPPDPTIGGAIAFLSRFMPTGPSQLSDRLRLLGAGELPGMAGWEWLSTPGHTPGHVSFFRRSDRVLLAGDAFASMDMDSWNGLVFRQQRLARAGAPFNCDWEATRASVQMLSQLRPSVAGCGHGIPIADDELPARLARFAQHFAPPPHGRYVAAPAVADEGGVVALPRAPLDPVPFATAAGLLALGVALGAGYLQLRERRD